MGAPLGMEDIWPDFHKTASYDEGAEGEPLAAAVLQSFGLPTGNLASSGGSLSHLDIKRMDALQVIKLSLLQASFDSGGGTFYELSTDNEGDIIVIEVGGGSISLDDIYYEIQSSSFSYGCTGVMVNGGKPLVTMVPLEWQSIWARGDGKEIFDVTAMETGCVSPNYSSHAVIVFNDPNLQSGYEDGIDNLYEVTDPFYSIIGYAKLIYPGTTASKSTNINFSKESAIIPLKLGGSGASPDIGTLQSMHTSSGDSACWTGGAVAENATQGAKIDIPERFRFEDVRQTDVDLYTGVEQLVVLGWKIDYFNTTVTKGSANQELTDENGTCVLTINSTDVELFRLVEGTNYVIAYDSEDVYALFSKRTFPNDPKSYGANTDIIYRPMTAGADGGSAAGMPASTGCVLPLEGNVGILVKEVWAYVKFNSPSITVTDTGGLGNASDIAEEIKFSVAPIISYEPPAPIAFDGSALDLKAGIVDKDPTSLQDFSDTPYEQALDKMAEGGHGMTISLSFLTEESEVAKASEILTDIMEQSGGVNSTTLCGPGASPELGKLGSSGGVINSINYSYSDSSSYTISVSEGDLLVDGLGGGCTLAPSFKTTESVSARGTVLDSAGDGVVFKVRIEGIGDRVAINTAPTLIRVGDVVTCSMHNVPVEV